MPQVGNKKFPYTKEGIAQAQKAMGNRANQIRNTVSAVSKPQGNMVQAGTRPAGNTIQRPPNPKGPLPAPPRLVKPSRPGVGRPARPGRPSVIGIRPLPNKPNRRPM